MGAPLRADKGTIQVRFCAAGEDVEAIEKVAQMKHLTKSEVIRQALDLYLSLASLP